MTLGPDECRAFESFILATRRADERGAAPGCYYTVEWTNKAPSLVFHYTDDACWHESRDSLEAEFDAWMASALYRTLDQRAVDAAAFRLYCDDIASGLQQEGVDVDGARGAFDGPVRAPYADQARRVLLAAHFASLTSSKED